MTVNAKTEEFQHVELFGKYALLANDPAIRKAVDDIAYDFWGEENPRALEDYEPQQDMTLGGM